MKILIIGGTRNIGHLLALELLQRGHTVSILNRGRTRDDLPEGVERLRADRTQPDQLAAALGSRSFDVVVDNAMYKGEEAETITRLLKGRVGHYLFLSTGQVYLVREGVERPFKESMYEGRLMPAPKPETYGYEEWLYGIEKRNAENHLIAAHERDQFPFTTLRLPMVTGERDHFGRLYGYILRLKDGGPILVPSTPNYPLRHVYSGDVVRVLLHLIESGAGKGKVYNISQDETVTLDEFLELIGSIMDVSPQIVRVRRDMLEANGFVPDCSPFSERWMSELDNTLSKTELGITYTPLREYLTRTVNHYLDNPPPTPLGYVRRPAELNFYTQVIGQVEQLEP